MEETNEVVPKTQSDSFLAASILVAALIIGGSVIYATRAKMPAPVEGNNGESNNQQAALVQALGLTPRDVIAEDANAPVTIIEYGDYQCPFCARFFSQAETQIRENYVKSGKVKMVYRNFAFLGPESFAAAEAAECAKDQGKFWAYHDALYRAEEKDGQEHIGNLNRALFLSLAKSLEMDVQKFTECVDKKTYAEAVQGEIEAGRNAGVDSTPSFFVNGKPVKGALPYAQFKQLIDTALEENT